MIGPMFDGDDLFAADRQHDIYGHACNIVCSTCFHLVRLATTLLGNERHATWQPVSTYDHRTLQMAHDLLAAAWRFRTESRQRNLFWDPTERTPLEIQWLDWLRQEVSGWTYHAYLVAYVMTILNNQNRPAGDKAESQLCLALMNLYGDVPWNPNLRCAIESDLEKNCAAHQTP